MSIDFVNRAIQIPYSSGFAAQEEVVIVLDVVSLFGRIGEAVDNRFIDALPKTLVGRTVFLTAIGFSIASFIAHYKAQPSQSFDREDAFHSLRKIAYFFLMGVLNGSNSFLSAFFLDSLVQFKTALTVLPYLKAPFSEQSQLKKVMQGAYTALKIVASTCLTIDVFRNCNRNRYCGFYYGISGFLLFLLTDLRLKTRHDPKKTNLETVESQFRKALGSHIATQLSLAAIASGIGGSLLYTGGLSCVSGILTRNIYDCLSGVRNISLIVGLILPSIKDQINHQHLLDQYSREFVERFSLAVYRAKAFLDQPDYSHFINIYGLAHGYSVRKTYPEQKQNIIATLKNLSAVDKAMCFWGNQPFLDGQEVQEFVETSGIKAWDLRVYLNLEQFQHLFLPKKIVHFLNANDLQKMQAEVEALKKHLMGVFERYVDLEKEQREHQIYKEIEQQYEKIAEYSSSIFDLNNILVRLGSDEATLSDDVQPYATELKNLAPQITLLNEQIIELETLIEEHTGDLTTAVPEAIGSKGFRVSDCTEMLETLQLPLKKPFETVSQMLVERGVKNQYDLIQKGILVLTEDLEKLKERLIEFLLSSDQPLQSVPAPVKDPSAGMEIARVSEKIYKYIAFPFFCALQFYAQPVGSLVGIAGGLVAPTILGSNLGVFSIYQTALAYPEGVLYNGSNLDKILYVFLHAQLTMCYFSRLGFIPALLLGPGVLFRSYIFLKRIRST